MDRKARSAPPRLSVVVVVHDMRREAPRTLYSLSAAHQRGVTAEDYEVVVVENGSSAPLSPEIVAGFGDNFRYFYLEDPPPSPAYALNFGVTRAAGDCLGLMIDGARMVTPGILSRALTGLGRFRRPVVATVGFHLGPDVQMRSIEAGYDQQAEDRLLERIDWPGEDGYRLFEISSLAASSDGLPPFTYLDYEARDRELHVHTYLAFTEECSLIKLQSIFEIEKTINK